ncbi:MAG TPA: serine hydrolase domain-containing protein [Acidimicrobiales bacterium]|nr:serine hydrolase domain-containing protein [Acidimicrobiales bacterium]
MLERAVALLEAGRAEGLHQGAQLEVRRTGAPPISIAVGEARVGVPMQPDTLLPWFSCTKVCTAIAVAQQWERGRLDLEAPVADLLPQFAAGGKGAVTVRHVLTHTGGFRTLQPPADPWTLEWDDLLARICATPLERGWVPGARAGYHAVTGFHVLGELVQQVDGRAFADYVSEEILEPLDMADSWMALTEERHASYGDRMGVVSDADRRGGFTPVRGLDSWRGFRRASPSGGGVGPMGDLVKVAEALLGGGEREGERILQPETATALTSRHRVGLHDETFGMVIDWGLGVMVNSWAYRRQPTSYGYGDLASPVAFGHGGQQTSIVFADPAHGLAVALCANGRPGEPANHRRTQPVLTAVYEDLGLTGP